MKQFFVKPQIYKYIDFADFAAEFHIGKGDLIFTHEFIYEPYIKRMELDCDYMFQERHGTGEPSSTMVDSIFSEMQGKEYKRIIAVGGGTVIDIAKLMVLKDAKKTIELFERTVPLVKDKELVIVPTTCGTGSEVTNLAIVEIKEKKTKMGLGLDEMYADQTVLIPELIKSLPFKFFVFSSIDALIHSMESFVSPKSNSYTELFSIKAVKMILDGYKKIIEKGQDSRYELIEDFLIASNYAGIAFSNTGVGAVHALSYPLGGNYHVPHGEANYQFLTEVFRVYNSKHPNGKVSKLMNILAEALNVEDGNSVLNILEDVLNKLISKKKLNEFGMKEEECELFADSVIETQQRLLVNNYVPFTKDDILKIYKRLY